VIEEPDELQVLPAGEQLVDGGVLACEPDYRPDRPRARHDVESRHPGATAVGAEQGRKHPHQGGLSGSVRSEQGEHPARLYRQGDLVEGAGSTEPFGERFYLDHPGRWRVASYGTDQFRSGKYDARSRAVPEIGISARTTAAVQQAAARAPGR
jgi:hypothetical protein